MKWLLVVALLLVGCSDDAPSSATDDTIPVDLITGDPADWRILVEVDGVGTPIPPDRVAMAVPLHVAREFDAAEPLSSYGLDDSQTTISFWKGDDVVVVDLGDKTFDDYGYYALVNGDDRVRLLLADQIDPLLEV